MEKIRGEYNPSKGRPVGTRNSVVPRVWRLGFRVWRLGFRVSLPLSFQLVITQRGSTSSDTQLVVAIIPPQFAAIIPHSSLEHLVAT